jgi:ABC-type polysaccharide/polyol phosphate transport system ATPase subunit/ABC-type polysaccharide/polyol phosphate export permease
VGREPAAARSPEGLEHVLRAAPAIAARSISKNFRLPHEKYTTVRDRVLHPLASQSFETLQALRQVSVEIQQGEFFGVVGKNGSGKSTLLRCLAGIYPVDAGAVAVIGRLVPFIELGLGFNAELAARENAITNAVLFGLSRKEAAARFDEMIAFAELEAFIDQKLKNYSTGMTVRLAFSVTVHVDADVLLFDEVLAVGDASFQKKCLQRFERLREEGKTVVLVTHDMDTVREMCDRAVMLHRGEVVEAGAPDAVAARYEELNERREPLASRRLPEAQAPPAENHSRHSSLLGPEPRRFGTLLGTLAVADFKLKYTGTALNLTWAAARPLAQFGALLLVFTALGRFANTIRHYPAYLLTSIVLWTFFHQGTSVAVSSLVKRSPLLRKLPFPHLAVPLSVVLTAFFDLCINLVIVFAFVLASGIAPRAGWLELPLLIGLLGLLATGFSLLLSALYVRFRDVEQVWQVASQTLFWLTPVFYVADSLPHGYRQALLLVNPIAVLLTEARHAVVDVQAPSAASVIGGYPFLLVPLGIVVALFVLGLAVLRRESPRAAENV